MHELFILCRVRFPQHRWRGRGLAQADAKQPHERATAVRDWTTLTALSNTRQALRTTSFGQPQQSGRALKRRLTAHVPRTSRVHMRAQEPGVKMRGSRVWL